MVDCETESNTKPVDVMLTGVKESDGRRVHAGRGRIRRGGRGNRRKGETSFSSSLLPSRKCSATRVRTHQGGNCAKVCNVMPRDCMWHEPCEEGDPGVCLLIWKGEGSGPRGRCRMQKGRWSRKLEEGRLTRRGRGQFRGAIKTEG